MAKAFGDGNDTAVVFSGIRYDDSKEPGVMSWRTCKGAIPGHALQMVQTAHRKTEDRWTERDECVTEFWRKLTRRGTFATTGEATCEWTNHPRQRHKICGEKFGGGLNKYRSYYHVKTPIRFRSSAYKTMDEPAIYAAYRKPLPASGDGLKILLVGELAYNPDRVRAFEEAGHKLYGLWSKPRFCYSTIDPLPFGNVENVPYDRWREHVGEICPDVIYALLSTSAIELAHKVLMANTGIPFVWHFKEGPHEAMKAGLWEKLIDLYTYSDGRVYLNEETRRWFGMFIPEQNPATQMTLDGDMPKGECLNGKLSPKLSETAGGVHTVVTGRMIGITPEDMSKLAANDIHVHLYNENSTTEKETTNPFRMAAPGHFHIHRHCPQPQWTSEFSKYDAGWLHCVDSNNGGSLPRATWADLNLPARISTLAAAGLPMIQKNNTGNIYAQQTYIEKRGMGLSYENMDDLANKLKDKTMLKKIANNVMAGRVELTFDSQVAGLTEFFRKTIARSKHISNNNT